MKISPPSSPRAFTLTEVIISMGIVGLAMAGIMTFYITILQSYNFSEQKLLINANTRNFTEAMMASARDSNYAVLYNSFYVPYTTPNNYVPYIGTDATTNWPGSSPAVQSDGTTGDSTTINTFYNTGDTTLTNSDRLPTGSAGDYVIFITYSDPFYPGAYTPSLTTAAPNPKVVRIVGFWIAPNRLYNGTNGQPAQWALYSFDTSDPRWLPASVTPANISYICYTNPGTTWTTPWGAVFPAALNSSGALEALLPPNTLAAATNSTYAKILVNDIRGQVTIGPNPSQGFNFKFLSSNQTPGQTNSVISSTAVVLNSVILDGTAAKHVTNTYNFTINPNG